MMKTFLTFLMVTSTIYADATIVVRGKIREVEHGAGVTSFRCKGNEGECVRIENGTNIAKLIDDGREIGTYSFTSYKTDKVIIEGEESTSVTLLGSKAL